MRNRRNLPNPAEVVRDALAEARREGLDFDRAWEKRALPALTRRLGGSKPEPRSEWRAAIIATRGEWRAAYEGTDTTFSVTLAARDLLALGVADYLTGTDPIAA